MDPRYEEIVRWASQPSVQNWRKWVRLLLPLSTPEKPITIDDLREYKPPIDLLCGSLLGRMMVVGEGDAKRRINVLPSLKGRIRIFLKGVAVVKTFRDPNDLMRLMVLRRQVTNIGGCPRVDRSLYALIENYFPNLSPGMIREIAHRMPPLAPMKQAILALASRREEMAVLNLAAE